ncbi:YhcN/YlaJ family sporulation lipoprotein [Tissierella sp. MB52-C2]|uniref:YhcN/YlaJ family sporulation lipoprotein n=1 Tax=Tissierella sp. MB52-C2 TaxID=3070999 RepID=UPI00280C13C5|nr:YhcN/YlaJ family sporulation lipoprotein [Tissierella sp. MB52-C2]WMM23368.1 YhcN/YlaJ family sporulation lipoprotein [Tissierella sp. MB52-C2]
MKRYLLFVLTLVLILQAGCRTKVDKEIVEVEEPERTSIEVAVEDKIIIDRSEDLSDYVVELFGVDDAATIIFNDIALVSVIMAQDSEFTEDTKQIINNLVLEKDEEISQVFISDDEKTFFQIVEIIGDLMNGSSYDKYVSQISKLVEKNK